MPPRRRLALVADIHHGAPSFAKNGPAAAACMERFAAFCAEQAPDAVIDLGDRISDRDRDTDLRLQAEVAQMFAPIAAPRFHINGNHDRDFLEVADNEAILGQPMANQTVDLDGWTLVLFRADSKIHRPHGFAMPEADLLWLADIVGRATQPLAIFTHVPLSGQAMAGNYWFQNNPASAGYPVQGARARAILAAARVPVVCVAGHVHWNSLTLVAGQPHLTLQSMTDTWTTAPETAGTFALLELGADIALTVHGADRFAATIPAAQTLVRPLPPLPPFDELPERKVRA